MLFNITPEKLAEFEADSQIASDTFEKVIAGASLDSIQELYETFNGSADKACSYLIWAVVKGAL